jgi:transcriptional regulator with XRE-family HTH domain
MVARRRAELGLSLREASAVSGVPVATLSRVEQGRMPDLATFRRIVEWLGVPPERFFMPTERTASTPQVIVGIVRDLYQSLAATDRRLAVHLRAAKTFTPAALNVLTDLLDEMQAAINAEPRG